MKKGEKGSALGSKEENAAMTKFFHDLSSPKRQMEVVKAAAAVVSVTITAGPLQDAVEHLSSLAGPKQKSKHPNKQQKEAGGKEEASPNKVDVEAKTNAPDGDGVIDQKKPRAGTRLFSIRERFNQDTAPASVKKLGNHDTEKTVMVLSSTFDLFCLTSSHSFAFMRALTCQNSGIRKRFNIPHVVQDSTSSDGNSWSNTQTAKSSNVNDSQPSEDSEDSYDSADKMEKVNDQNYEEDDSYGSGDDEVEAATTLPAIVSPSLHGMFAPNMMAMQEIGVLCDSLLPRVINQLVKFLDQMLKPQDKQLKWYNLCEAVDGVSPNICQLRPPGDSSPIKVVGPPIKLTNSHVTIGEQMEVSPMKGGDLEGADGTSRDDSTLEEASLEKNGAPAPGPTLRSGRGGGQCMCD